MKKIFKSRIFFFILGALIFGIIGVGASTLLYSKDVTYDNTSSGLSATNLQDALDELYEQSKSSIDYVNCDENGDCILSCPSETISQPISSGYKCVTGNSAYEQLKKMIVTSGSGLYVDSVESGRYIYRGASPKNYVTFNGETWRIIAVESDRTLKIMKQDSIGDYTWDDSGARKTNYCNSSYGCNSWGSSSTMLNASGTAVTSMPREYGGTAYTLPTKESTLNQYLNGEYYNSLSSIAKSQIVSHIFNVGVLKESSNQVITTDVTQESTYKWKGKIALANASDYVRASTNSNCTGLYAYKNTSSCYNNGSGYNWMYNSSISYWWTLSPISYSNSSALYLVSSDGYFLYGDAKFDRGIRPVVYLSSNLTLSGSGTSSDPYTIN